MYITIKCDCGIKHRVPRTSELPDEVISLGCNWCPGCEDTADDTYNEWYVYDEEPEPIDPNQLKLL